VARVYSIAVKESMGPFSYLVDVQNYSTWTT